MIIMQKHQWVCGENYRDEPADDIRNSKTLKFKLGLIDKTGDTCTVNVKIAIPLKYLHNFWRTVEISLFNRKINLVLTWSANCVTCERDNYLVWTPNKSNNTGAKLIFWFLNWSKFSCSE